MGRCSGVCVFEGAGVQELLSGAYAGVILYYIISYVILYIHATPMNCLSSICCSQKADIGSLGGGVDYIYIYVCIYIYIYMCVITTNLQEWKEIGISQSTCLEFHVSSKQPQPGSLKQRQRSRSGQNQLVNYVEAVFAWPRLWVAKHTGGPT